MKNTNLIILIVVAVIIGAGIYLFSLKMEVLPSAEDVDINNSNQAANVNVSVDLNTTSESEVLADPNPQGTVATNYSTVGVATTQQGKLAFYVTDPASVDLPEQAQANKNKNQNQNQNMNQNQNRNQNQNQNQNMNGNTNQSVISPGNTNKSKGNEVELASLVLTFSKVQVHLAQSDWIIANNNANLNSNTNSNTNSNKLAEGEGLDKWEVLNVDTTKEYDLIAMKNAGGSLELLGITDLAAGKYTQIRMYVSSAKATTIDGEAIDIEIPGQNNIVKIVRNFTIEAGETTKLTIDFDALSSLKKSGNQYLLRPVVGKMLVDDEAVE